MRKDHTTSNTAHHRESTENRPLQQTQHAPTQKRRFLPLAERLNINNVIFNKDFDQSICIQQQAQHACGSRSRDRVCYARRPLHAHSIHLCSRSLCGRGARALHACCYRACACRRARVRSMIGDHVQHDRRRAQPCFALLCTTTDTRSTATQRQQQPQRQFWFLMRLGWVGTT